MPPLAHLRLGLAALLLGALPGVASAQAQSRGELLYSTHCIACHTSQMHWREQRQATDWASLRAQVARWQGNAGLGWNDEDVTEVARHLNATIYHFKLPPDRRG